MLPTPRSVAICLAVLCSVAHWLQAQTVPAPTPVAETFKTVYGKEYKDATVSRVEPDGIVLTTKSGISKVYFTELPKEVQQRFHYDPAQAAEFTAATQAGISENKAVATQQALAEQRRKAEFEKRQKVLKEQREAAERQAMAEAERQAKKERQAQLRAQQEEAAKKRRAAYEKEQKRLWHAINALEDEMGQMNH
jgi:hypothetical protein